MRRSYLAVAVAMTLVAVADAQMSMGPEEEEMMEAMGIKGEPMGRKNQKPQAELLKNDLKYIRCNVCRKMVDVAYAKSKEILEKRFKFQKKRKRDVTEFDGEGAVQDFVEKMCNPLKPEGDWVGMIDLKEEGTELQLAQQQTHGKCLKECRTIEYACEDILDKADTEFTEILYSAVKDSTPLKDAQRYICNRAAGVCKKKPPLLKNRKGDEKFQPMTAEEKQMQDMQANLKESGMSGTMYKREDLAGMTEKMEKMERRFEDKFASMDVHLTALREAMDDNTIALGMLLRRDELHAHPLPSPPLPLPPARPPQVPPLAPTLAPSPALPPLAVLAQNPPAQLLPTGYIADAHEYDA